MDDRELLEMAAKAVGVDSALMDNGEPFYIGPSTDHAWNPLEYDGDAMRLAAKLRMTVDIGLWRDDVQVRAYDKNLGGMYHINEQGDLLTAARRCIVRAAAEIGKAMP